MLRLVPLVLLILPACASGRSASAPSFIETGREVRTLTVAGRMRTYELHLPARRTDGTKHPLVFAFHGAGSTIESLARASGFGAFADRDRWAVVYPQGIGARFDTSAGSADVALVRAILDDVDADLGVDRKRVHATGFSNGGFLCYRLVADLPGTFASIAPVAGLMPRDAVPREGCRTSLFHVHGLDDRRVPHRGRGDSFGAFEGAGRFGRLAGCTGSTLGRRTVGDGTLAATAQNWICPKGVQIDVLLLEGTGHAWPGGPGGWLSDAIWKMFKQSALP